jgi:hypothetical protein
MHLGLTNGRPFKFSDGHSEFPIRISHASNRSFHRPKDIWRRLWISVNSKQFIIRCPMSQSRVGIRSVWELHKIHWWATVYCRGLPCVMSFWPLHWISMDTDAPLFESWHFHHMETVNSIMQNTAQNFQRRSLNCMSRA